MNGYPRLGLPVVPTGGSGASRIPLTRGKGGSLQQHFFSFWMLLSVGVLKAKISLFYGGTPCSILRPSISSGK